MEPRKKRKVEPVPPPAAPTSAFALRKRLLQQREEQALRAAQAETTGAAAADVVAGEVVPQADKPTPAEPPKAAARTKRAKKAKEVLPDKPAIAVAATEAQSAPATPAPAEKVAQPIAPPARTGPVIIRSSFQPTRSNFHKTAKGHLNLKIDEDQRIVILGSYGLTVKEGEVTLAGAILRASDTTHWVHAPRCHALPVLRCTDDASIVLQPHPAAPALRELAKLSPVFAHIWNEPAPDASADASTTFQIIYTSDDCQAVSRDLSSPAEWNRLIADLTSSKKPPVKGGQPVYFVCGPKSSGKSTFSRLLANRILTMTADVQQNGKTSSRKTWARPSLAVLDIDPGQPEYGTPGTLSLVHVHEPNFAPTFCHPYVHGSGGGGGGGGNGNRLLRAHETATVSPATDPEHYMECAMDLFALYRRDLRSRCALVVNTPGWIQGTGLALLKTLAARMQPTKVIYMSLDGPEDTVQGLRAAYANVPLVGLPSAQPGDPLRVRTAAHLRSMQTMSYFHLDLDAAGGGSSSSSQRLLLSWNATPLTAVRPWTVPYAGPTSGILGIVCYDSQPPPHLIADAINGTVVSIVAIQNAEAFRTTTTHRQDARMDVDEDEDDEGVGHDEAEAADEDEDEDGVVAPPTDRLPPLVRSPEGLPFILNPGEAKLDPRHSHKLGVALVRGIDAAHQELHLLTPVPVDDLLEEVLRQDGLGVVLVSGKFDIPTWAYTEDSNLQDDKMGKADKADDDEKGEDSDDDGDGDEEGADPGGGEVAETAETAEAANARSADTAAPLAAETIPWVQVLQGRQTRDAGSQVWRVRRDLGRNTAGGGD